MVTAAENTLDEIRAQFANDRFATLNGCTIVEARVGHCIAEMPIDSAKLNAHGAVMGGAIFTLADFAMAVASNLDGNPSVSIDVNARFLSAAKGTKLIATCNADRAGRTVGFYTVTVTDDTGRLVSVITGTMSRAGSSN